MHRTVGICAAILAFFVCMAAPVSAIAVLSATQGGAGQPMTVTLDMEGTVSFQYAGGTPIFAHGTTVKFIPPAGGVVTFSATDPATGTMTTPQSITITELKPTPPSGGGGGDDDGPTVAWKTVTLHTGTFNVTADNSGKTHPVSWRSALGVLQAAGISFKVSDKWDSGLFVFEVDGKPGEGSAGWVYRVNGESPAVTADKKSVSVNDKVVWYYSESMSQTPEQSPEAFFYKVQTSAAPAPGGSSTETGDTKTGDTETGQGVTADMVSYPLSLPPGSDLRLSEGRMYLTANVPMATAAGDLVGFVGNTMVITRDDVSLKIRFADFTDKEGIIAGEITDVTVETTPVTIACKSGATPEVSLLVSLLTVPMDADLGVATTPFTTLSAVPADVLSNANTALGADGMAVGTAGWMLDVGKRGLEDGVDVGDVTVRITTEPAFIAQAGGLSALRLIHIMDDGTTEVLALRSAGTTEDGKTILEAGPAAGLSSFLFVSVTDAPTSADTAVATTTPSGETTTPAPTESGTPLSVICAATAGILGITGIYRNKKR